MSYKTKIIAEIGWNHMGNMDLAKEMIEKCINLTKESPSASFIDTYAWVLYKLGDYGLAKEQIEIALELSKESAVLWDHYGDILHNLGLNKQALLKWQNALKIDSKNKIIEEKINKHRFNE